MKKIFIIITFLTICLLGGCQNTNSTATEQSSVTPSPIETEKITAAPSLTPTPTPTPSETVVEQREDADFRNTKWGDNRETVLEYETEIELTELDDGSLGGTLTVLGYDMIAGYIFMKASYMKLCII